jgi:hypothetical protein
MENGGLIKYPLPSTKYQTGDSAPKKKKTSIDAEPDMKTL